MKKYVSVQGDRGSVLIGIILTMVIASALGVAMFSMTSSTSMTHVSGQLSKSAYYLAESGFKYTASQFLHVTDNNDDGLNNDQNNMANTLNGRMLQMTEGNIGIDITPFHYATSGSHAIGDVALSVQFPGATPAGFAVPPSGSLHVRTQTRPDAFTGYTTLFHFHDYTSFSGNTFTLSNGLNTDLPEWTSVSVLATPASTGSVTPGPNATLTLDNPMANSGFFMPPRNGNFRVGEGNISGQETVYRYDYRVDNPQGGTTTLHGIYNTNDPADSAPITLTQTSVIVPNDFFRVESVGTVGDVSRTVTFITPVDIMSPEVELQEIAHVDTFDMPPGTDVQESRWHDSVFGSHSLANVSGGTKDGDATSVESALHVTGSYAYNSGLFSGTDMFMSLIPLKWGPDFANFYASWNAHDNTLSYDAQVKVRLPQQNYYMAGMNFRMNVPTASLSAMSSLGVSLQRGLGGEDCFWFFCTDRDGIENALVPLDDTPVVVLWRKAGGQSPGLDWIAYKIIGDTIMFNNGQSPYFQHGANDYFIRGGSSGARANVTSVNTTDNGLTGSLVTSSRYSNFQSGEQLFQLNEQSDVVARVRTPISSTSINYDLGESAAIQAGDIIQGQSSRARVTNVTRGRYYVWFVGYRYRGTLTITETEGTFSNNEWLDVHRPSANHSARFVSMESLSDILVPNTPYIKDWTTVVLRIDERLDGPGNVNDIRVYVGDTDQHGTPDGSPLDAQRFANKRWSSPPAAGDVKWPPEEGWSSGPGAYVNYDHFTLIQNWTINPDYLNDSVWLTGTTEEPNTIVRTNQYTTNSLLNFTQNEIGLHTFGDVHGNTYFDDFGVKMAGSSIGGTPGFSYPLQY